MERCYFTHPRSRDGCFRPLGPLEIVRLARQKSLPSLAFQLGQKILHYVHWMKKVNVVNHISNINWKRLKLQTTRLFAHYGPRLCSSGDLVKTKQLDPDFRNTTVFHRLARQKIQRLHFERPKFYVPYLMHKLLIYRFSQG